MSRITLLPLMLLLLSAWLLTGCPSNSGQTDAAPTPNDLSADAADAASDATADVASDADVEFDLGPDPDVPRSTALRVDVAIPTDLPFTDAPDAGESLSPPRQIAPLSAMRVTSQRPTLRWELPAGVTGARVELCGDPDCHAPLIREDVIGASYRPAAPLPSGVIFWHVAPRSDSGVGTRWSPIWEFGVRHRDTPVDSTIGMLKDFNGDGYDDLALAGVSDVMFVYGSSHGLDLDPTHQSTVADAADILGLSLSAGGDINGDGIADQLICTSSVDDSFGKVYVHMGRSSGIQTSTDITLRPPPGPRSLFGETCSITDVNGDGLGDIIVGCPVRRGAYVYWGAFTGVSLRPSQFVQVIDSNIRFGANVSGVGDVNGDGYGDVLIGSSNWNSNTGRTILTFGSRSGLTTSGAITFDNPNPVQSYFGIGSGGAGDMDGDGLADLTITSFNGAYLYRGSRGEIHTTPDAILNLAPGDHALQRTPYAFIPSRMGDTNADGFGDVVLGPACEPEDGSSIPDHCTDVRTYLFRGGASDTTPSRIIISGTDTGVVSANFGVGTAQPGDLNGDGFDDFVVGSVFAFQPSQVFVYFGRNNVGRWVPDQIMEWPALGPSYGELMVTNQRTKTPISSILRRS